METLVTAGGLRYGIVGSGPPMLWLSGYVVPYTSIEPYVSLFAHRYTCIVFDARGAGGSPASWWPRTTRAMAVDALAVLREAGHDSAHVHGISLGGMVAQELAIMAPHRVRTVILGATTPGGCSATPAHVSVLWSELAGTAGSIPGVFSATWHGAFNQAWAASRHDATSRLGRVTAPALVMHGTSDQLLPVANAEVLAALLPRATLRLLAGWGHLYPLEAPSESADVALSWLEDHDRVGPARAPCELDTFLDLAETPLRTLRNELLPWLHAYRACRPRSHA